MNGKELLQAMDYVQGKYIEEAETAMLPKQRLTLLKPLLVAALIAMTMLLVGCAVVYVWKMQNIQVGEQTETKAVLAENGIDILGYEEVNQQVLTLAGLKGSPGYQAAMEWFRFKQDYDPEHILHMQMISDGTVPDFPEEYGDYNLYSQEMKDELDRILADHGLKPAGATLEFRTLKNMCAALGVERIQKVENGVTVNVTGGGCRENGNFTLMLDFLLPEAPENEIYATWGNLRWNRKDCFSEDLIAIENTGDWKEWNYTTASGNEVLIIRADSDWRGWILCEREEAILSLELGARRDLGNNDGERSWWDYLYLTDRQMEQIADAVDFGIQPRTATQADVDNQPAPSNEATQDGYTVELKDIKTDGQIAYLTIGITAPEGKIISRTTRPGYEEEPYHIITANYNSFKPVNGEYHSGSFPMNPQEDGDGLDNTQNFVIEAEATMTDGSCPFGPGSVWRLRMEDLIYTYYDKERYTAVDEVLAEGEWVFDITFGEDNGDFREIEFMQEPVTLTAETGFRMDGSSVYEDIKTTSLIIRSMSAALKYEDDGAPYFTRNDRQIYAVMKDGTRVQLQDSMGGGGVLYFKIEPAIDPEQIDYVLLTNGTKLMAP